jgi:hypothetical protein
MRMTPPSLRENLWQKEAINAILDPNYTISEKKMNDFLDYF